MSEDPDPAPHATETSDPTPEDPPPVADPSDLATTADNSENREQTTDPVSGDPAPEDPASEDPAEDPAAPGDPGDPGDPAPTLQRLNHERFNVFNEGLLFYATKLLLKELKMDTGDGAQSGEDTDRELDCMLELPAARKPLNSPEEVLQYWNSCFEKE